MANIRKSFLFAVDIDGVESAKVQKVSGLSSEFETAEHGAGRSKIKTAGLETAGDVTLETIQTMQGIVAENFFWRWHKSRTKKDIIIRELAEDETTTLVTWLLSGCLCKKFEKSEFSRTSSDNLMQTVTLSVDRLDIL